MTDPETLAELIQNAVDTAWAAGAEMVADSVGSTWTCTSLEAANADAKAAQEALEKALGL